MTGGRLRPVSATVCGLLLALEVTVSVPFGQTRRGRGEVNVRMLQLAPAAMCRWCCTFPRNHTEPPMR